MKDVKEEKKCPCEQCVHGTYMIVEKEWWCDKHLKYASQMERNRRCEKFETISGDDAISRQAVLDIVRFEENWLSDAKSNNADTDIAFSGIRTQVAKLSSVTPARKKGKWIYSGSYDVEGMLYCSCCQHEVDVSEGYFKYCPNCGAKMEK